MKTFGSKFSVKTFGPKFSVKIFSSKFSVKTFGLKFSVKTFGSNFSKVFLRRTHDTSRHVSCDVCGKLFAFRHSLRKHVARWHTGIPDIPCPICPRKFFQKCKFCILRTIYYVII